MSSRLSTGYSRPFQLFSTGEGEGVAAKERERERERECRKKPISYKNHENHFT